MTPRLRAALENKMSLWPKCTEEGRPIPGAEPMRRISILSSFNWSLSWTTQTFTSEMQASMVCERVKTSEGEPDLQFGVIRKHMMRDRVVTDYIRTRLSIQNEENWSQNRTLGDPTSQKWRRGFYSIHSYYLCPVLQVGMEEGQGKIKYTKSAFEASQKNAMIDCVEGSA